MNKNHIAIKKVSDLQDIQTCLDIRKLVFVEGQNVPLHEEVDGKDKDSEHYLLTLDKKPAGTARIRYIEDIAKIERVAILAKYRGQGLGKYMMQTILADLIQNKRITMAKLGAQTHAIPFYETLGFEVCSEVYLDAGIPHKDMKFSFDLR
ncbi:GNAT family N-acetyltransferase [Legionella nagasakiensis]|uniref:GNAT family N-acetyltransferase n=1 Tax=Legionella nagasakiensis TaxID=535290 RepID=UPI001054D93B|nr:GNAT family N-acetyltransferase [Legionella nagasakiensis]